MGLPSDRSAGSPGDSPASSSATCHSSCCSLVRAVSALRLWRGVDSAAAPSIAWSGSFSFANIPASARASSYATNHHLSQLSEATRACPEPPRYAESPVPPEPWLRARAGAALHLTDHHDATIWAPPAAPGHARCPGPQHHGAIGGRPTSTSIARRSWPAPWRIL
jgi:hypothetical protein